MKLICFETTRVDTRSAAGIPPDIFVIEKAFTTTMAQILAATLKTVENHICESYQKITEKTDYS
ncbi:MAG: hypothetical protein JXJ04_18400 [Spirochaetales bacterium]|nr:hypothetical protein [Spirochaetales bacterium]